jgi:mono/diheme cytochrome c family protein
VRALEPLGRSLMPNNYQERLSPSELNDLVSYLMKATPSRAQSLATLEDRTK